MYVNKTGGINQLDPLNGADRFAVNINEEINLEDSELNIVLKKLFEFFRILSYYIFRSKSSG